MILAHGGIQMSKSILTSVKENISGITEDYTAFDNILIPIINAEFAKLCQLGVGPADGFSIADKTATWDQFTTDPRLNFIEEYVTLRVKILFDSSDMPSFVVEALKQAAVEYEWRLQIAAEELASEKDDGI
jgi:hypothetical protein